MTGQIELLRKTALLCKKQGLFKYAGEISKD